MRRLPVRCRAYDAFGCLNTTRAVSGCCSPECAEKVARGYTARAVGASATRDPQDVSHLRRKPKYGGG